MKKLFKIVSIPATALFLLAVIFSATSVSAASQPTGITLSSPSTGSVYYEGDTVNIRFGFQGRFTRPAATITLTPIGIVAKGGTSAPMTIASNITTNSYNWKIPKIPARNYMITVRAAGVQSIAHVAIRIDSKPVAVPESFATLSKPVTQIAPTIYAADTIDGSQNVPALIFGVVAGKTPVGLSEVTIDVTASSSGPNSIFPTTVYLYEKTTNRLLVSSAVRPNNTIKFTNIDTIIGTSTRTDFLISFDMPSNTIYRTAVAVRLMDVVLSNKETFGADSIKLPYSGASMLFVPADAGGFTGRPSYRLDGAPAIRNNGTNQVGSTTSITASFPLKLTAVGGHVKKPLNTDFRGAFVRSNGEVYPVGSLLVSVIPGTSIASSTTADVTVVFTQNGNALPSGIYSAKLTTADGANTFTTPDSTNVMALGQTGSAGGSQAASAFDSIRNFVKSVFGL